MKDSSVKIKVGYTFAAMLTDDLISGKQIRGSKVSESNPDILVPDHET